jgi:hypothetical protein
MSDRLCVIVCYVFRLPAFKKLSQRIQEMPEFGAWLQQGTPEQCVPQLWEEEKQLSPVGSAMYQLLVIQVHSPLSLQLSFHTEMKCCILHIKIGQISSRYRNFVAKV